MIDDIKQYYSVGENFETNCTSNSSIPPAKLEWWINDMPIYNAEYTIKYSTLVDPSTNRQTSLLGLRLPLTNEHFYRGRVKVSKRSFVLFFFQFTVNICEHNFFQPVWTISHKFWITWIYDNNCHIFFISLHISV